VRHILLMVYTLTIFQIREKTKMAITRYCFFITLSSFQGTNKIFIERKKLLSQN
jgi:hypothetical protein